MSFKERLSNLFLLGLALLLPQVVAAQSTSTGTSSTTIAPGTPGPVAIQMNQYGLTSLTVGGRQWLGRRVNNVLVGDFFVSTWRGSNTTSNYEPRTTATLTGTTTSQTYPWGSAQCTYTTTYNTLDYAISVTNTDPAPFSKMQLVLGDVMFPGAITPKDWNDTNPPNADNYDAPAVLTGDYGTGVLALVNTDVSTPALTQFSSKYWGGYPIRVTTEQPIPAGATVTFHISLRWAPEGTNKQTVAPDVWAAYQATRIQELNWKDRRPIGSIFLATVNCNYPTNPRGWYNNPTINVFTTQGQANLKTRLMATAAQVVKELKDMNAQGCIVWDVEGEQYPQGLATFIGDPTLLPTLAPEMDPLADTFFSTIKNAGFRVGVCLRCQHLVPFSQGGYVQTEYPDDQSIFNALDQRITYAQQRWGCTLFYLDTNGGVNGVYDVSIFQQLQEKHPDVLLIPEEKYDAYFAYTAPYYELRPMDGNPGTVATPADAVAIIPGAFSVINTADGDVVGNQAALLAGVKRGDILMYRTWFYGAEYAPVKSIYQQATANGGPVAAADIFSVHPGTDTVLDVLLNDFDQIIGRPALQVVSYTQPTAGSVYMQNGYLHYVAPTTPPAGGSSTFTFNYTASDGVKTSAAPVTVSVGQ
ncbi:MAG: hypothetical protein JOY92_12170 [Verrucomicrobia bacterium]|nr:hypothetical protein [Verrucomicrobiota bacterium]